MSISIKKHLCDPPAQRIAECGDPEIQGMFEGAGAAIASTPGPELVWFERAVIAAEERYMKARKDLAASTAAEMKALFDKVLAQPPAAGAPRGPGL
jgi:hypothetical protein